MALYVTDVTIQREELLSELYSASGDLKRIAADLASDQTRTWTKLPDIRRHVEELRKTVDELAKTY